MRVVLVVALQSLDYSIRFVGAMYIKIGIVPTNYSLMKRRVVQRWCGEASQFKVIGVFGVLLISASCVSVI